VTTAYALLLDRCGLSFPKAAALHDVRSDTVKSWSAGRNPVPAGVIDELRELYARIERAAEAALALIAEKSSGADAIDLRLAADDAEAQSLGWPCMGAQAAVLGIVAARCGRPVRIVEKSPHPAAGAAGA